MSDIKAINATRPGNSNRHDPILVKTPTWLDQANCAGQWEKADQAATKGLVHQFTRRFCSTCPVRRECFDYGVSINANSTIFGGVWFTVDGAPAHNTQGEAC